MILRILESDWAPFAEQLVARLDVETAGVILAERLDDATLVARECLVVPDDGYQIRAIDRIRIDPVALNRLIRRARDHNWSVITIHTHPRTHRPWFSAADDQGDSRLMPSLFDQMPGPHGSAVLAVASQTPGGRIWTAASSEPVGVTIRIVGRTLRTYELPREAPVGSDFFTRQTLALGDAGQAVLRGLHVAVVGLGGTGSVVFSQLAHLGVGTIAVIDGDRVEAPNLSRIIGATRADVGLTLKVGVAERYAAQLNLGTHINTFGAHLGDSVKASQIANADVVFSCVDKHTPRALLNRMAYEKAIPVIDMGSAFRVDDDGGVSASAGRVVVIGPGRPCLACWGHIDPDRLRIEALSPEDRAQAEAEGYIQGAEVAQPSVVAFNTLVAGAAVVEFLRLVTAFAGANDAPSRLHFDFASGTVRRNSLGARSCCSICGGRPLPDAAE